MEHMPPECMGGFDGPMMHYMPHDCMAAMGPMHMEHMPPEAMAAMPLPPEAYDPASSGSGVWGDTTGGFDGMASMGATPTGVDPMADPMGGDAPMGGEAPMGGNPAFDGAMAAMDGAQAANMAEGMDAANTAAEADEGKVDTEPSGSDVV